VVKLKKIVGMKASRKGVRGGGGPEKREKRATSELAGGIVLSRGFAAKERNGATEMEVKRRKLR